MSRKRLTLGAIALAVLILGAVPFLRWRAAVLALQAFHQIDGVDWADVPYLMKPTSGIRLSTLVYYRNGFLVIRNPLNTPKDRAIGKDKFASNCARCHGEGAKGGAGPTLVGRALTHGDSDWAMFRTIHYGVAGTAMLPVPMNREDVWRVIGYLRELTYEATLGVGAGSLQNPGFAPATVVTPKMLATSGTNQNEWLLPQGSYNAQRFSTDAQINTESVKQLSVQWIHQFGTADARIEATPIVVGGRLYVTLPQGTVMALDARSGQQIWQFDRPPPADTRLCCVTANRGVSVLGSNVYVGTLDAHLLALDAGTGKLVWDQTVADYQSGYSLTSAPLPVENMLITGIAGGDFPTRGFVSGYDANTGALLWRTYTVPTGDDKEMQTWGDDSSRPAGAATWGMGSYDPETDLVFWGTGNPAPDFNAEGRPGDNLYSNSLLALERKTGRLAWYFQYTPGDDHDWDSMQTPIQVDRDDGNGVHRKLILVANRNAFYYVIDRTNGHFVSATAFAKQTWAKEITATGRPVRNPETNPTPRGIYLYPSTTGATNWWPASFSAKTNLYYVNVLERGGLFFSTESPPSPAKGRPFIGSGGRYVDGDIHYTGVRAIEAFTGKVKWEHRNSGYNDWPRGGLLSTAGGVVFGSDTTKLFALDAQSGEVIWSFDTGGQISAPPVSFRVDGRQYIAVAAGQMLLTFALPVAVAAQLEQPLPTAAVSAAPNGHPRSAHAAPRVHTAPAAHTGPNVHTIPNVHPASSVHTAAASDSETRRSQHSRQ